jgi:ABC-type uncharacterized transport system involved in gliding motility auxiliary subunit
MQNQKLQILNKEVTKNMQTNTSPKRISEMASKAIDKFMLASGVISVVWILAFLLVAMIAK